MSFFLNSCLFFILTISIYSRPCNFFLHVHLQFLKMISKKDFTQLIVFWPLPDSSTTFLKFHFFDCTLTVPITKLFQININDSGTHRRILMHFGLSVYDTWIERFFGKLLLDETWRHFWRVRPVKERSVSSSSSGERLFIENLFFHPKEISRYWADIFERRSISFILKKSSRETREWTERSTTTRWAASAATRLEF